MRAREINANAMFFRGRLIIAPTLNNTNLTMSVIAGLTRNLPIIYRIPYQVWNDNRGNI